MLEERRFGRRLALPSTVQIVRELQALMRAGEVPTRRTTLASTKDDPVTAYDPPPIGAGLAVPPIES